MSICLLDESIFQSSISLKSLIILTILLRLDKARQLISLKGNSMSKFLLKGKYFSSEMNFQLTLLEIFSSKVLLTVEISVDGRLEQIKELNKD